MRWPGKSKRLARRLRGTARGRSGFETLERRELLTASPFSADQQSKILAGLGNLKTFGDALDAGDDLATPVPGLGATTIGDLVDLGGRFDGVRAAVKGYFDGDGSPTVDELQAYLGALDQFKLGGSSTVSATVGTDVDETIRLAFTFTATGATTNESLALDALDGVGDLGLSFAAGRPVSATGGVVANLAFSVTKDGTFAFFVSDIDATAAVTGTGLAGAGRLGFLDVGLTGGTVSLTAQAESQIASELTFTTDGLAADPGITFAPSGTLAATLPLAASIGGYATTAGSLPTVTLASTKLFEDLGAVVTTNAAFANIAGFGLYSADEMLGTVRDVGAILGRIADRPELAAPIPFSSQSIGGLLDLEAAFNAALVAKITTTVDGTSVADFKTAAELLAKLPTTNTKAPSVAYDATSRELAYTVTLAHAYDFDAATPAVRDAFQTPVTFDLDLRPFTDLATSATLSISVDAGIQLTFGVDLDVASAASTSTQAGVGLPENGRITADAAFRVSLDGAAAVAVALRASATNDNADLDNLVTDLNAALLYAGLSAALVAEREAGSSRISLRHAGSGTRFRIAADQDDPFVTELGFAPQSLGRATVGAGFLDDTTITAKVTATAASVPLTAGRFGFIDITLTPTDDTVTGKITGSADVTLALKNPDTKAADTGRVTLDRANAVVRGSAADFATLGVPNVAGSAKAEFKGVGLVSDVAGLALTGMPSFTVSLPTFGVPSTSVGTATATGQFDLGAGKVADDVRFTLTASDGTTGSVALTQGAAGRDGSLAGNTSVANLVADLNWAIDQAGLGGMVEAFATGTSLQVRGRPGYGAPTVTDFTTIVTTDFGDLKNFRDMKFSQIVGTLRSAAQVLSRYEAFGFLASDIPLAGVSVIDLLGYAADYSAKVEQIAANPAGSLKQAEKVINDALGLKPADPGSIRLQWDATNKAVKVPFVLQKQLTEQRDLLVDIAKLARASGDADVQALLAGVDSIFDAAGSTKLTATTGYSLGLSLGIDLSETSDPGTFLYTDQPLLAATAGLRADSINLQASLGAVGVYVRGGSAVLNKDGNPATKDAATFAVSLLGGGDNKLTFAEIDAAPSLSSLVDVSFKAGAGVSLPLYGPSATTKLGDAPLTASIPDLVNFFKKLDGIPLPDVNIPPVTIQTPNLAALFNKGILELLQDPTIIVDGLDTALSAVQAGLRLTVFNSRLPVVGTALAEQAGFLDGFRGEFLANLRQKMAGFNGLEAVQKAVFDSFEEMRQPGQPSLILDANNDRKIDQDDVTYTLSNPYGDLPGDDRVVFNLKLGQAYTVSSPLAFDLGLPALGFDMNAGVNLTMDWSWLFKFGVDMRQGFFLDTSTVNDLAVKVDAALVGGAVAKLGFLQANADTIAGKLNGLKGTFAIDLVDPSADGRLTFTEIASPAFSAASVFKTVLTADAGVHLALSVSAGGSAMLPKLLTDFRATWSFDATKKTGSPKVAFDNVRLDVGSLASDFIWPIVQKIQQVLEPTKTVLDKNSGFLRQRVPVISDLLGRSVNFIEFGLMVEGRPYSDVKPFLDAYDFVMGFQKPSGNVVVPLGAFNLDALGDLSVPGASVKGVDVTKLGAVTVDPSGWDPGAAGLTGQLKPPSGSSGFTFSVPLLESGGWKDAFKLLLGQDVDLFKLDMNVLKFDFNYRQFFPILGPIGTTVNGSLSIRAGFVFGFDTYGFRQFSASNDLADVFNGFYVKADGTSQIVVNGGISAGVAVNLGAVQGGVEGGVFASIRMALRDLDTDGRLRLAEIVALIDESPLCLFKVSGEVTARLYAWYEVNLLVTKIRGQKDIVNPITLASFATADECDPTPVLASQSGGTLTLHVGTRASDRQKGDRSDGSEKFTVEHVSGDAGNETVRVRAFGFTKDYSGVSTIVFNAGNGNDTVDCRGVLSRVEGEGGDGDDTIWLGDGGGRARGGNGTDTLTGGRGDDDLDGEGNNDTLAGNAGNDTFRDESGTNTIIGGDGTDLLVSDGTGGADTLRLWADRIERLGAFTNTHSGVETVRASGGDGADRFEIDTSITTKGAGAGAAALVTLELSGNGGTDTVLVFGTRAGSTTSLAGDADDDTFLLTGTGNTLGGKGAASLDRIYGGVTIDAGNGAGNRLVVDDSGSWGNVDAVLEAGSVTGVATGGITFTASGGSFTSDAGDQGIRVIGSASKSDVFTIRSTGTGNTTRVEGLGGNDLFSVGSVGESLDDIRGLLTIAGGANDATPVTSYSVGGSAGSLPTGDMVILEDSGHASSATAYEVTKTAAGRVGGPQVVIESSETIDLRMGAQAREATVQSTADSTTTIVTGNDVANAFTVRSTGASSLTRLFGAGADDAFLLSSGTGTADEILGVVEIDAGSGGGNTLVVDDSLATKANTAAVITADSISGVAGAAIGYTATGGQFTKTATVEGTPAANDGIVVRNTAFADTVAVRSTRAGSTTRIEGLGGSDTFVVASDETKASDVASQLPSLDGIVGTLTIAGGDHDATDQTTLSSQDRTNSVATGDVLLVADQGDGTAGMQYGLTPSSVDRTGMSRITYVSTETIRLRTGRLGSTTEVTDTVAGGTTFIVGNTGVDRVDVVATGTGSNLEVSGAGAADVVHLRATGASSFTRILGEGGDDRAVISSAAGTGNLAAPNYSPDGDVASVRGVVSIDGGAGIANRLVVDDSTSAGNADVLLTNNRVTGLAAGEIHYAATGGSFTNAGRNDGVLLRGSAAGRDVFLVTSTLLESTTRVDTQGGNDLVSVGSTSGVDRGDLDPMQGLLTLDTGSGTDNVHVNDHGAGYDALRSRVPKPLNDAATQTGAVTFENTAKFNYRLDATSLRNHVFEPKAQDSRLGLIGGLPRAFAGIDYVGGSLERLELVGTDNVNVFTVLPSVTTTFFVDGKLPVSGAALFGGGDYLNLDTAGTTGRRLGIDAVGEGRWRFSSTHQPVLFTSIERFNHVDIVAVSRENTTPRIDVYDAETNEFLYDLMPYEPTFRGSARVATGDVNNDGLPDVAVVSGRGRPTDVRIFDGSPNAQGAYPLPRVPLASFSAFATGFAAGGFVAIGDTNRDGASDLAIGADGGSTVRVFANTTTPSNAGKAPSFAVAATFDAFERTFRGGTRVAAGDLNGDGFADVAAGRGPGGLPEVRVFSGRTGLRTGGQSNAFVALINAHRFGVTLAVGDYNGDGVRDVIVGSDSGGLPMVSAFDGTRVMSGARLDMRSTLWSGLVYPQAFRGGVNVITRPVGGPVDDARGGDTGFVSTVAIWTAPAARNSLRFDVLAHEYTGPNARPRVTPVRLSRGVHVDGIRLG
jgi:hypothetical protein